MLQITLDLDKNFQYELYYSFIKAAFCIIRDCRGLNGLESCEVDTELKENAQCCAATRNNSLQKWSKCSSATGAAGRRLQV